jgi:hypothetical protein
LLHKTQRHDPTEKRDEHQHESGDIARQGKMEERNEFMAGPAEEPEQGHLPDADQSPRNSNLCASCDST